MADKTINTKVRLRYDSEANWKSKDPVLLSGEMAISSDKDGMHKVGNGTSKWSALSYVKARLDKNDVTGALGYTPPTSNTWRGIQNNLTSDATDQSLSAAQGKILKGLVDGKAASSHTHDDRYYTESEINSKLSGYSTTSHTHDLSAMINTLSTGTAAPTDNDYYVSQYAGGGTTATSYHRRPVSALWSYIKGKTDSLYQAKGSYAASSHTHDDRYYTETEINSKLAAKAENSNTIKGVSANGYYGLARPDANASDWIRTSSAGLLPYQSGNSANGHSSLGTSSWYFNSAYIQNLYANQIRGALPETYLSWGGANLSGGYSPIDAAMVPYLGANRLAFPNPDGVKIEYSRDSGATWTDYGADNYLKKAIFSTKDRSVIIGKSNASNKPTASCMVRITLDTDKISVYTALNKFVMYISTEGCGGCYCTIDASTEATPTTFVKFADKVTLSGWGGYNVINTSGITTFGNSASTQYGLLRFTFGCTSVNTTYNGLSVFSIMGFGGYGWNTPSNMAAHGHVYNYDADQNVTFPANVKASSFTGNITGNASTASKLATARTISLTGSVIGSGTFDGSGNLSINTSTNHTHSQYYDSGISRTANTVLAAPNGSNGGATFRKLVAADIPTLTKSKISDFPGSLPASDVYSWAKASTKPSYTKAEVGLGNVDNTADANKSVKYATSAGTANSVAWSNVSGKPGSVGSSTQPIYFSNGTATACAYTLGKSVPSNAVFTDTWRGIQNNLTSTSTVDSLSAAQGKILNECKLTRVEWNCVLKCATWSRVCYIGAKSGVTGSAFLFNIYGTRNSVVFHNTFMIKAHHSTTGCISKISGSTYGSSGSIRLIVDSSGNCYVEYYDTGNGATNTTTQSVNCTILNISTGAVTTYTSFTDGSSIPSGYAKAAQIDINTNSLQGNLTWSEITGKPSTFTPSSHTHSYAGSSSAGGSANSAVKLDSSAGSATQPVYFSGGKPVACSYTLGKSVPSNAVFTDTNTWRPLGTTADTACAGNDSRLSNARPASDVYSWAKASSKPSYSWSEITGKPSTFAPSSHTHNYAGSSSAGGAANSLNYFQNTSSTNVGQAESGSNGIAYITDYSGTKISANVADGALYRQAYNTNWVHQIYGDYRTGSIAVRGKNNGTWQAWHRVLDESNYKSYCTPGNIGAAPSSHTHNYAGSSSAGGAATSANKLNTNAGSATQPVYFSNGVPVACSYTLGKSVPSNAVFTDTNTWRGVQNNLTSTATDQSLSAYQGKVLNDKIAGKSDVSHSHYLDTLIGYHDVLNFSNFSDNDYLIMSDSKGSVGCIDAGAVCATENVVDNLSSTSSVLPLSANQGRVLNSKISGYVNIKNFSISVTLSKGYAEASIDGTWSGYTILGIVRVSCNTSWMSPVCMTTNGNTIKIGIRDIGTPTTSTATVTIYCTAIYVKS